MTSFDPTEWVSPTELPATLGGKVSLTFAKRLFRDRGINGLAARSGAVQLGRRALLHVPTVVEVVFGRVADPGGWTS